MLSLQCRGHAPLHTPGRHAGWCTSHRPLRPHTAVLWAAAFSVKGFRGKSCACLHGSAAAAAVCCRRWEKLICSLLSQVPIIVKVFLIHLRWFVSYMYCMLCCFNLIKKTSLYCLLKLLLFMYSSVWYCKKQYCHAHYVGTTFRVIYCTSSLISQQESQLCTVYWRWCLSAQRNWPPNLLIKLTGLKWVFHLFI